jgi:hypothetical protein
MGSAMRQHDEAGTLRAIGKDESMTLAGKTLTGMRQSQVPA